MRCEVIRSFYLTAGLQSAGSVVDIPDRLVPQFVAAGKIRPAPEEADMPVKVQKPPKAKAMTTANTDALVGGAMAKGESA